MPPAVLSVTMTLIGECEWCDRTGRLRFKPDSYEEQTRPTICEECRYREEARLRDFQRDQPPYPGDPRP